MKIHRLGAEVFRADGQTDVTKIIVTFRYFANVPKHFMFYFTDGSSFTLPFYMLSQPQPLHNIFPVVSHNPYHHQCPLPISV